MKDFFIVTSICIIALFLGVLMAMAIEAIPAVVIYGLYLGLALIGLYFRGKLNQDTFHFSYTFN